MKRALGIPVSAPIILLSIVLTVTFGQIGPPANAEEPELLELTGDLGVHDPVLTKDGDTYYIFYTGGARGGGRRGGRRGGRGDNAVAGEAAQPNRGGAQADVAPTPTATTPSPATPAPTTPPAQPTTTGPMGSINMLTSPDMKTWTRAGFALPRLPDWTRDIPNRNNPNDAWAPDISYFNNMYHLYYSISSFGRNDSAIGQALNVTLDPKSPEYKWEDGGLVIESERGRDDFNCIDPNIVVEDDNNVWICWGSFWGGIMMRRIDAKSGRLSSSDTTLYKLARRAPAPKLPKQLNRVRRSATRSKAPSSSSTMIIGTCSSPGTSAAAARIAITRSPSAARKQSPAHTSTRRVKTWSKGAAC